MNNAPQKDTLIKRREFIQSVLAAGCALLLLGADTHAGFWRQRRRRVRRRQRRRIRRRIAWRIINGTRFVVVPVNILVGDELIMENGSIASITAVTAKSITFVVNKKEETVPVVFEGSVEATEQGLEK